MAVFDIPENVLQRFNLDSVFPTFSRMTEQVGKTFDAGLTSVFPEFGDTVARNFEALMPSLGTSRSIPLHVPFKPSFGSTLPIVPGFSGSLSGSFRPDMNIRSMFPSFGDTNLAGVWDWMRQPPALPDVAGDLGAGGFPGSATGAASILNQYDAHFAEASSRWGVPAHILKAIAWVEQGWGESSVSHAGATGIMQIMPGIWGDDGQRLGLPNWRTDPRQNILLGAWIFSTLLQSYGNVRDALRHYHGIGWDGFTTDQGYADAVLGRANELQQSGGAVPGGMTGGSGWAARLVGQYGISQGLVHNDFTRSHASWYAYGYQYGLTGQHTGLDITMPSGTPLSSPVNGVVEVAGCTAYFVHMGQSGVCGQGQLQIRTTSGHIVILGHMSYISVRVGQRVAAGQSVGRSGSENGGHLHLEYRVPDRSTSSGWRIVDPRQYI